MKSAASHGSYAIWYVNASEIYATTKCTILDLPKGLRIPCEQHLFESATTRKRLIINHLNTIWNYHFFQSFISGDRTKSNCFNTFRYLKDFCISNVVNQMTTNFAETITICKSGTLIAKSSHV